jgi:hypothetical protein
MTDNRPVFGQSLSRFSRSPEGKQNVGCVVEAQCRSVSNERRWAGESLLTFRLGFSLRRQDSFHGVLGVARPLQNGVRCVKHLR